MKWPNSNDWAACKDGVIVQAKGISYSTLVIPCGELSVPGGKLMACDPFTVFPDDNSFIQVPRGRYPVFVTSISRNSKKDSAKIIAAYASIILVDTKESYRKWIPLAKEDENRSILEGDDYGNVGVDNAIACFIDAWSLKHCMPELGAWGEVFHYGSDCWLNRLDDPSHIRIGIANVSLPKAKKDENAVIFNSGYGDGNYPVVGSYDANDKLIDLHIDFLVICSGYDSAGEAE